jgi:uncharacterized protein YlxW (UPF0749 family)
MSLLVDLSTEALDPGYAAAAARRRAAGEPARPRWPLVGATVLAATLVVVVAAVQTRASAPAAARSRSALVAAVNEQSATVGRLERSLAALTAQQAALRDATLASTTAGAELARRIKADELALGTVAVSGPGLRVTLGDAPASGQGRNRVLDRDLQAVTNALWTAGAEAIAVNGQRLTAQSAIRQAGDAILVDFRPLVSPYVVTAVGSPVDLETQFGSSRTAARMRSYAQLYGLTFGYARAARLALPAAADATLHYARPTSARPTSARPTTARPAAPAPSPRGHS